MTSESPPVDLNEKRKVDGLRTKQPYDLRETQSYVWYKRDVLGKGSFGKVCRGWDKNTYEVVAVKIIRREHYERDAKVRQNLLREIQIQKALGDCENVVRLLEIEKASEGRILIMELCDSDLQQHVKKVGGLNEEATKDFLKQIANGLKRMHEAKLVHRDLKPGNILLKKDPLTNKIIYKLADFGFARSLLSDDQLKTLQMQSLAGTPVFMAPEALECVFHPGKSYDAKVDLWSVGALLYNILIGKPGFYATLQLILDILKRKGDAIAFDRNAPGGTRFIYELPSEVDSRLSRGFKEKMNTLLIRLLKLDPKQRMTFQEFFDFVDTLTANEIVLFHVGPGYRSRISQDPIESCKSLFGRLATQTAIPRDRLVAITEQGSEKLIESENVPQFLKVESNVHRIFVYNEQSLDSSLVPTYISPAVRKLSECLQDATERHRLLNNPKMLSNLCEFVIKDANEWSNSQIKGLHCYQALLGTCSKDMDRICEEISGIREKFEFQINCIKESMEVDKDCLDQVKASEKVFSDLKDKFSNVESKQDQFLLEVEEIAEKCRKTKESIREIKSEGFDFDYRNELPSLVRLADEARRLEGEESLNRAELLITSTKDYHMYFIEGLHRKMRGTYFALREGRFLFDTVFILRKERWSRTLKEVREIQRGFKQSVFQAMAESSGEDESKRCTELQEELLKKNEDLEKEKEARRQVEKKLVILMNEKAERDTQENGNEASREIGQEPQSMFTLIPGPESLEEETTIYETAKKELPLDGDTPDGAAAAAAAATTPKNEPEATIQANSQLFPENEPEATIQANSQLPSENEPEATIQANSQLPLEDEVKVSISDVQKACKGLQLAANFYRNLAKMTRVFESDEKKSSTDVCSKRSASASSYVSVSPSSILPSEDLKTHAAEVEGFDYKKIQDALRNKVSLSNFGPGDLVLFWPTSAFKVFRAMTTTPNSYFLQRTSLKDFKPELMNGRAILATVKAPLISTCAIDGDKYKMSPGQKYYIIRADVKQFL